MIPDTCVPTSTSITGSMVPVAVTELEISPLLTVALAYITLCFAGEPVKNQIPPPTTTATATAIRIIFFVFILYSVLLIYIPLLVRKKAYNASLSPW